MTIAYCPLFSGSSGNAAVLRSEKTQLLIDAGLSGKTITGAMEQYGFRPQELRGILITHEHSDHIKGAGILSRKLDIPIYANAATWQAMEGSIGPVAARNVRIFRTGEEFFVGDVNVTPYSISHDAAEPVGYSFCCKGRKIAQMTDLGYAPQSVLEAVSGAELLLLESNHDIEMLKTGSYTYALKKRILGQKGHLSNEAAGDVCLELAKRGVRRFILGHLSRENNLEELAYATVCGTLQGAGALVGKDVQLYMAHRDRPAGVFELE